MSIIASQLVRITPCSSQREIKCITPFRTYPLYLLWTCLNAGSPGHICLIHSFLVPPHKTRHLGTVLMGNFPQVDSVRGTQAYLCLCPYSASFSADPALPQAQTHSHCIGRHTLTANSDIKPCPEVDILCLYCRLNKLSIIWPQAVFCISESQNTIYHDDNTTASSE